MPYKVAYIGPSYHSKTKSTEFLINYLKEFYEVDVFAEDISENDFDYSLIDEKYNAVIFFQVLPTPKKLRQIQNKNIIFFPMYDGSFGWKCQKWFPYKNIKIVNFSRTLHEKLKKWGFNSSFVQFFIEPKEFLPGKSDEVFFWNRVETINFNSVKKILDSSDVKIHIHTAIDPNHKFIKPSEEDIEKFSMTFSDWFETREEMQNLIKERGIYIAPRPYEGIGMSFLEAMAMGKVVIANDQPTMNEYITNGVNGFLCDFTEPEPITLENIELIQKNVYEYMKAGYQKWTKDKYHIIERVAEENHKITIGNLVKMLYSIILYNLSSMIKIKIGKHGYLKMFGRIIYEV